MGKHTFFLSYRTDLLKRYEGLFNSDEEEDEESEAEGGRITIASTQMKNEEAIKRKWSWISLIYKLCEGDITKTEAVVSKPFTECLVWLSYEKEMNIKK